MHIKRFILYHLPSRGFLSEHKTKVVCAGICHLLSLLLAVCLLTLGRVELDAVLPAPAGVVDVGRGGGDHPVVVVDLL